MVFHRDKNAFSKNISTRCDAMNFSSHEIKKIASCNNAPQRKKYD